MAFDAKYQDLGRRIVRAARLAAVVHMYEAAGTSNLTQRVEIGGAGPCLVTEDDVTDDGVGNDNRRRVEPSTRAGGAPHAPLPAGGDPPDAADRSG